MEQYRKGLTAVVDSVAKRQKLYQVPTKTPLLLLLYSSTRDTCEARLTSSQLAWWRTVSLGTYWYCCSGVLVYQVYVQQCSCTVFFFVSAIETLIVVACHVLFVTTIWISENELRESINIYRGRAEVRQKSSYSPTI